MTFLFISYAPIDARFAAQVRARLESERFNVWMDDVVEGDIERDNFLRDVIAASSALIVIESPSSAHAAAVRAQTAYAQRLGKPIFSLRVESSIDSLIERLPERFPPTDEVVLPRRLDFDELEGLDSANRGWQMGCLGIALIVALVGVALWYLPTRVSAPRSMPTASPAAVIAAVSSPRAAEVAAVQPTGASSPVPRRTSTPVPTTRPPSQTPTATLTQTAAPSVTPIPAPPTALPVAYQNRLWRPVRQVVAGLPVVFVPAGCFVSTESPVDNESDVTGEFCVEAFWIGQTEVTNTQYARCVDAGACTPLETTRSRTRERYYDAPQYADYPVIHVSWEQARMFSQWAGGDLPSEIQWRYAAQGPQNWRYPWGGAAPEPTWLNYNGQVGDTERTGSYPDGASWVGARDMAGNVWEWTSTVFDGRNVVIGGGSWNSFLDLVKSGYRATLPTDERNAFTGFRIALPADSAR